jgi:tetratricopeptide (TPR) repeat protein
VTSDLLDPLDEIGRRFEVRAAETFARARPDDADAQRSLAYAYAGAGRHEDALAVDLKLVAMDPENAGYAYDLACTYALLGRADEAFAALDRAVDLGFDDEELLASDDDLAALRVDGRWEAMVRRVSR